MKPLSSSYCYLQRILPDFKIFQRNFPSFLAWTSVVWFYSFFFFFCFQPSLRCKLFTSSLHSNPSIIKWKKRSMKFFPTPCLLSQGKAVSQSLPCPLPPYGWKKPGGNLHFSHGFQKAAGETREGKQLLSPRCSWRTKRKISPCLLSPSAKRQSEREEIYMLLRYLLTLYFVNWKYCISFSSYGWLPERFTKCDWY